MLIVSYLVTVIGVCMYGVLVSVYICMSVCVCVCFCVCVSVCVCVCVCDLLTVSCLVTNKYLIYLIHNPLPLKCLAHNSIS